MQTVKYFDGKKHNIIKENTKNVDRISLVNDNCIKVTWLLCQESGHKSTNKFDFQFKLLNLIFGGRSFSPVQILKTL
ncbi:hypothetical protein QY881_08770 [Latilactobacillus sakei]|uniref:hypothetical protein n=1 Tax=Latilactobacillus sakei TaxID=1599 RepID=UPI0030793E8A